MNKVQVRFTDFFAQTILRMREDGLLLVSTGTDGKTQCHDNGLGTSWLHLGPACLYRVGQAFAVYL